MTFWEFLRMDLQVRFIIFFVGAVVILVWYVLRSRH